MKGNTAISEERKKAYEFFGLLDFKGKELSKALGKSDSTLRRDNGKLEEEYLKYKEVLRCIILSLNTQKE
jgi:hypothetical protein